MARRSARFVAVLAVAAVSAAILRWIPSPPQPASTVDGSASAEVAERLERDFGAPFAHAAVVLLEQLPVAASSDAGRAIVRSLVAPLAAVDGVVATASPASLLDTLLIGSDDRSALVLVGLAPGHPSHTIDSLRAVLSRGLAASGLPIVTHWSGASLLAGEAEHAAAAAVRRAEWVAIPVTLMMAVAVFGGIGAAVQVGGLAMLAALVALAALRIVATVAPVGPLAVPVTVVVAVGLTLDYALWRRLGGFDRRGVAAAALVAITGFAALLLAPVGEIRGAALGGVIAVVSAAVTVLLWHSTRQGDPAVTGQWNRGARLVVRRPLMVLVVTLLPLGWLAWRGVSTPLASDPLTSLPDTMPSIVTLERLESLDRLATVLPVTVLVELAPGTTAFEPEGWHQIDSLVTHLGTVAGVARVDAVTTIGTRERTVTRDVVPDRLLASYLSRDHRQVALQLVASPNADVTAVIRMVDRVDSTLAGNPAVRIGGVAAMIRDHQRSLAGAIVPLVLLASLGSWLALLLVLRAPVAAAKAVLLNLLVAAGAIGVVTVVSPASATGLPVSVPLVAFGTAFAISIDYELLLLLAVRRAGGGGAGAIVAGVATAAPLFVRGGALLAVLFAAFAVSPFVPLALLGRVLVAAIVLDVLVVRPLVAPALLMVLGRWNWWPAGAGAPSGSGLPSGISAPEVPRC